MESLSELYTLTRQLRTVRYEITNNYLANMVRPGSVDSLRAARDQLAGLPARGDRSVLRRPDGREVLVDLSYEIGELEKDIVFLDQSEDDLYRLFERLHDGYADAVAKALRFIGDEPVRSFITDRDGTVNNYCGRYLSSVQSVYNAVFLSRFAMHMADGSVILTSAPLEDGGLLDISVAPENLFTYAGSKGREYRDATGKRSRYPIEEQKQQVLNAFNRRLDTLVRNEEYQVFPLIGSGVQYKFGQTTVARQDISGSVPEEKSEAFLHRVSEVVREVDPDGRNLVIEDTGKDIEVILTVSGDGEIAKDFDKGDGIRFLDRELDLGLTEGPTLICGDTTSDVPMVEAARAASKQTKAIFVTTDKALQDRLCKVCPDSAFLDTPDMLVGALNEAAKRRME
jgi:hypothetical protein